jgi:predicted acylesterase/phospholipase RssA
MSGSKTALVISGGGAKGAFAVGVIKHLFLRYRDSGWFSIVGGTSTGALISPMAALMGAPEPMGRQALEALEHLYTNVSTPDILEKQNIFEMMARQDCLNETDPLNKLLHQHVRPEWFEWLQGAAAPACYVVYTDYQSGRKVTVSPKDEGMTRERFLQSMLASASVPVVMEAAIVDDAVCYDGGVRGLLPFGEAIGLGAERIVPIYLDPEQFPWSEKRFKRIDDILLRTLEILVDEAGRNDFEMANLVNIAIQARQAAFDAFADDPVALGRLEGIFDKPEYKALFGPEKRVVEIIAGLRPQVALTDDSLTFDPDEMRLWVSWGQEVAGQIFQHSPFV